VTTSEIGAQYATGLSRRNIERALTAAGKGTAHLAPADLGVSGSSSGPGRGSIIPAWSSGRHTGRTVPGCRHAYAGGGVNPPVRPARVWANAITARSCR
jgi:hypothetical protein